jgi:hypothetical protein
VGTAIGAADRDPVVDRKALRTGRRQVRAADLWITSGAATTFACTRSRGSPAVDVPC